MSTTGFALFDTAIGRCGIAWGDRGVAGAAAPREAARRRRAPGCCGGSPTRREAPPPREVQRALDAIAALLRGEAQRPLGRSRSTWRACRRFTAASTRSRAPSRPARPFYGERRARGWARRARRARSGRRSAATLSRSSCPATACSRRAARWAASPPTAASRRSSACWPSRAAGRRAAHGALRRRRRVRLRPGGGRRSTCARPTRRWRALIDAVGPFAHARSTAGAEHLRRAGRGHRLPAAERQGRGDDLRPRLRAVPARRTSGADARADPARVGREAARRRPVAAPSCCRCAISPRRAAAGEIPTLAEVARMDDAGHRRAPDRRCAGIGRWTVEMLLMFRLGRPDVLPVDDYGVRKGFALPFKPGGRTSPRRWKNAAPAGSPSVRWPAGTCGGRSRWPGPSRRPKPRRPRRRRQVDDDQVDDDQVDDDQGQGEKAVRRKTAETPVAAATAGRTVRPSEPSLSKLRSGDPGRGRS